MTTEDAVAVILNEILRPKGQSVSGDNEKIFESGLFDSFGILEVLLALEAHFQIKIPNEYLTIQNFSSIIEISKLVERLKCKSP